MISWHFFSSLKEIQDEGFNLANKFTTKQMMSVALAVKTPQWHRWQIDFLNGAMKHEKFQQSEATFKLVRVINRRFDMLNSRSPIGKGFKQLLRPETRETWEEIINNSCIFCWFIDPSKGQTSFNTQHFCHRIWHQVNPGDDKRNVFHC